MFVGGGPGPVEVVAAVVLVAVVHVAFALAAPVPEADVAPVAAGAPAWSALGRDCRTPSSVNDEERWRGACEVHR